MPTAYWALFQALPILPILLTPRNMYYYYSQSTDEETEAHGKLLSAVMQLVLWQSQASAQLKH